MSDKGKKEKGGYKRRLDKWCGNIFYYIKWFVWDMPWALVYYTFRISLLWICIYLLNSVIAFITGKNLINIIFNIS